jgi:hypothetical protein
LRQPGLYFAAQATNRRAAFWNGFSITLPVQLALINHLLNMACQNKGVATAKLIDNPGVLSGIL